jgi:transposase
MTLQIAAGFSMSQDLIDDHLWTLVEPLLPGQISSSRRGPGRKPTADRVALNGIIFVLKLGIPWNRLPQECGFATGAICRRRLEFWQRNGIWPPIYNAIVAELYRRGDCNTARAIADSLSIRARLGEPSQ